MSTLSIHNLDPEIERRIRERAKATGRSLSQTARELLAEAVGATEQQTSADRRKEFEDLFGIMTEEDWREADEILKEFERIDPEIWQ